MPYNVGKLNCLKLGRIWNFLFLLLLHVYLVYDSIYLYIKFKKYLMDIGFQSNYSAVHMNAYLICMIMGLTCLLFSLYFFVFFNGNYADDNVRLGKDTDNFKIHQENDLIWHSDENMKSQHSKFYLLKRIKSNFLPYSFLLHYLSAICFLMPLPFLEAHQIRQRILKPNAIWHTDLDFLFDPDSWHETFIREGWRFTWLLRPQYFNLIFCLICLIMKYPGVFWDCHKSFAFTFSFLLTLASIHIIMDYSTTSVLIRLAANPDVVPDNLRITFISPLFLMILSTLGSIIILLTFWCVFEFGFQKFLDNLSRYRHLMDLQYDDSHNVSNLSEFTCCKRKHLFLRGYLPHVGGVCGCAIGFSMKTPLFFAGINIIYHHTSDPMMIIHLVVSVTFIFVWLITWFGFSLKQSWRFFIANSKGYSDITSTTIANSMSTMLQHQKLQWRDHMKNDGNNQIYACYHEMNPCLIINETRRRSDDICREENDVLDNLNSTNYVYLQNTMNQAINQILVSTSMSQSEVLESPLMVSYNDNLDFRNTVSESESSYDSASNIRNNIMISLDPRNGRFQTITPRQAGGVLKYTDTKPRSHLSEYIQLKSECTSNSQIKFDSSSSTQASTLVTGDNSTFLISPNESHQKTQSVSFNRQNSKKNRIYGQRVTFKDEQITDGIDCSANNSEQSSNNTSSSDSGIDSNSKQSRNIIQQKTLTDINNDNLFNRPGVSIYSDTDEISPAILNSTKQNTIKNDLLSSELDRKTYFSENDQERLCSQV